MQCLGRCSIGITANRSTISRATESTEQQLGQRQLDRHHRDLLHGWLDLSRWRGGSVEQYGR